MEAQELKSIKTRVVTTQESSNAPRVRITSEYLQKIYRRLSLITVVVPALGTAIAIALLRYLSIGPVEVSLLLIAYALSILGIEVGFHRHFSHRAFDASTPLRVLLAILGSMAAQGGVIFWVAHHRCHHQYTDRPNDPHSPHLHDNALKGLWHAHVGWTLEGDIPNSMLFAKDLLRDPVIAKIHQYQQYWVLLGLAIPAVVDGLITRSWVGVLQGFLWGGLVRIFLGQQIISSTNSICHVYGGRLFDCGDRSTNNLWLAIPSWGQSWHNNHHAFPSSAIAGLKWWQIDPGSWVVRGLEKLGLVWNVKVPTLSQLEAKKIS
jgi:stearoyl-CoA desaturase (Delta-9 desaturase)